MIETYTALINQMLHRTDFREERLKLYRLYRRWATLDYAGRLNPGPFPPPSWFDLY